MVTEGVVLLSVVVVGTFAVVGKDVVFDVVETSFVVVVGRVDVEVVTLDTSSIAEVVGVIVVVSYGVDDVGWFVVEYSMVDVVSGTVVVWEVVEVVVDVFSVVDVGRLVVGSFSVVVTNPTVVVVEGVVDAVVDLLSVVDVVGWLFVEVSDVVG